MNCLNTLTGEGQKLQFKKDCSLRFETENMLLLNEINSSTLTVMQVSEALWFLLAECLLLQDGNSYTLRTVEWNNIFFFQ
jgi:hypothetical protein